MNNPREIRYRSGIVAGLAIVYAFAGPGDLAAQDPAASTATEVTLEEAVERALAHSPQMAQSRQQVLNAEESKRTAWGAFLPSLSGSAGGSLRSTERFDQATDRVVAGSSDSYNAGVSARYTLFAGGERFASLDAARAGVSAASAQAVDQRFAVILDTKNQFFEALRQDELAAVASARVQTAEESLRMTRERAQLGEATSSDTLRARLELVRARQAELQAESTLRNARVSLGRQIGIAGPVAPTPPATLDPRPLALDAQEILGLAEEQSPSVQAATASATAAGAEVSAARTQYLPSLNVSTGYDWANQAASFGNGSTSWNVRLSMSYPIFNGFQRESQVARAQASFDVAQRQEEDVRLAARAEADAALQALRTQELAIDIGQEAVEVAEEDLRVVRERYRANVARIFDVVESQVALADAQVELVQARYDYLLALAQLEAILGREL
jgi:outer membrane protein TolC